MYRVIEMYGDFEPWWFIEGWEEDVIMSQSFDKYYDALKYYKSCWFELEKKNPLYKSRSDLMTIFGILLINAGVMSVMSICSSIILWHFYRMSKSSPMKSYVQVMKNKQVKKNTVLAV